MRIMNLTSGFILALPNEEVALRRSPGFDAGIDILNEERYRLGLLAANGISADGGRVNSVFRPALPRMSEWWRIRTAY